MWQQDCEKKKEIEEEASSHFETKAIDELLTSTWNILLKVSS